MMTSSAVPLQIPMPSWLSTVQPGEEEKVEGHMDEYGLAMAMYKCAAAKLSNSGVWLTPRKVGYDRLIGWLSIKQIADSVAGFNLPPISPADALALSEGSPFSAEDWYLGCGGIHAE